MLGLVWFTLPLMAEETYNYNDFSLLPIQHQGRIKPMDSFARIHLQLFSGRESITTEKGEQSAIAWLAELLFAPELNYQRPIFNLDNSDLRQTLDLPRRQSKTYSFIELSSTLRRNQSLIDKLGTLKPQELSPIQKALLDTAEKSIIYFELSRSFSLFAKIFSLNNPQHARKIGLSPGQTYNYLEIINGQTQLVKLLEKELKENQGTGIDKDTTELLIFANLMDSISNDRNSQLLKVLPQSGDRAWTSLWENIASGSGNPRSAQLFTLWQELSEADKPDLWQGSSSALLAESIGQAEQPLWLLRLEVFGNRIKLFRWGFILYIMALLSIAGTVAARRINLRAPLYVYAATWIFAGLGLGAQLAGLIIRMLILARPPVTSFYESLLFVTAAGVLGCLILEYVRRDYSGLFLASILGISLSLLGFYQLTQNIGGDSMRMLIAVLNSNYWLATHVIVITLGYAAAIISSLLGHIYILNFARGNKSQNRLVGNILAVSLIALSLMILGTTLGGIWADQSWGRFWGWDPKENGALLIILWLIFMLHARLTKFVQEHIFAVAAVALNICVALSWYGVNLLGVGLHSYGFIDYGTILGLIVFILAEIIFIIGCLSVAKLRATS